MGKLCALIGLSTQIEELVSFPISGGRFLVTGKDFTAQCGQDDFRPAKKNGARFFIIVTKSEPSDLWVADVPHKNVDMPTEVQLVIANLMDQKIIIVTANQSSLAMDICNVLVRFGTVRSLLVIICTWFPRVMS